MSVTNEAAIVGTWCNYCEAKDGLCLPCVLPATTYSSQRRGMSWFGRSVGRCRARGITVMDWGPVDNTCVNTVCLFPEPCALGVGSVFLRELSLMAASHIAPEEEESPWTLKEKSVLAKGSKTQLAPGTSVGPSHASQDGAETCLCQEACHDSPITSPVSYRWEKVEGKFLKGQSQKVFMIWAMGFLHNYCGKAHSLQFRSTTTCGDTSSTDSPSRKHIS